ncbi:MAG TPA: M3 family metallopeptidase [Anaeromyxobacter sp.]|nr:M3 family metallopeptidase [Anaeromyxobacter sp.]
MEDPLLAPWPGPYGGVPPFQSVKVGALAPALDAAMKEQLAAVERIAEDPAPPTFENTLAALERSGRALRRVRTVFGVWTATLSSPEVRAIEKEVEPKLAAMDDRIVQNEKLFRRIEAVYDARETACKDAEQKRLAWRVHTRFVRAGARLDAAGKQRVAEINQRLAALFTAFRQNVLADEEVVALLLRDQKDLAGLPPAVRSAAAAAAAAAGHPGRWAILNTRSSVEPFLTYSARRDLREEVWRAFVSRGDRGGDHDNKEIITEILALRAERAKLRGYPTHAHWRVEDTMARTPERALALMETVWPAAVARVREEVADMKARAAAEGVKFSAIEPWDYRYWAEKVRKAKYDVDEDEVKPYLQLERLREAMFWVAGKLFDFHFAPAKDVPVQHPDVRVWEVKDGGGRLVGLWYFDPFARDGKQSGAWMNAYRRQERLDGAVTPIVSNNANFVKATPGEPVLVSWIDAKTLFHEFGHALHGLSSSVTYPSLSGTDVARDYVEFPSQLLERWLATPEVLRRFAVHFRTGEPMPDALVRKIARAEKFNQGFDTVEYLSAALVDMKAHLVADRPVHPASFERETLAALRMPREIVMRHRMPQFLHVFAGDGYSAGYYSYLWSDTLSADAYEAFTEAGGPYDQGVATRLKRFALSVGDTVDPAEAYRSFRGRDPDVRALMRRRGFPEGAGAAGGH